MITLRLMLKGDNFETRGVNNFISFIIFVMKWCAERKKILTSFFLLHFNCWEKLFMKNPLILDKVM